MSVQIFLQGKILGIDSFLHLSSRDFEGRAYWTALLSEVLPRALLAELGLSRMLLGCSGGDQFLLVLPGEVRHQAEEFCRSAALDVWQRTGGCVRLEWSVTENLGDWTNVRKRLIDELYQRVNAPAAQFGAKVFDPGGELPATNYDSLVLAVRGNGKVGWSPDRPGDIQDSGKHTWELGAAEGISYARHVALDDDGEAADAGTLAARAKGTRAWAVLIGDVDAFGTRLQRAQSIEEHIQLSIMFRQFFVGELQMVCLQRDLFQRVSIIYTGGDKFAVYGSWDACLSVAREMQRVFQQFVDANLKELPGLEGKTISMAVAIASSETPLERLWSDAMHKLDLAKASGKDGIYVLGRTLEWKQLTDAADSKNTMARMITDFGCSPQFLHELSEFYKDSASTALPGTRRRNDRLERPWRFHRRLNTVIGTSRNREFQRLRTELIADFTGRASQIRLRPQGRVALEWAKLETGV